MREYKKMSVYILLEQLLCEVFKAVRVLPHAEQALLGIQMRQAILNSVVTLVHGATSKNSQTFLPYLEESHAYCEEFGQLLRICRMWNFLPLGELDVLVQRQESCSRLLLQMRRTILLSEEERRVTSDGGVWESAVSDNAAEMVLPLPKEAAPEAKRRRGARLVVSKA